MAPEIRVVHVEADPEFATLTADRLEREADHIEVVGETDPDDALATLEEGTFDCVVSGHDVPDVNGLELLEAVRERFDDLPFVLFTGNGSEEVAAEAIRTGVTDYLRKEGTTDQFALLADRIENAVEARTASRERQERGRGQFSALFENFPEPTISYRYEDGEPVIRSVNDAFVETFGYPRERAVGSRVDALLVPPARMAEAREIDQRVADGEMLDTRVHRMTATGERVFKFRNIPYRESEGVDGFAVYADITERVERERALRRENERLDEFASIIAHDLRNPLNVAQTRTELAAMDCESEHLEHVHGAHERMETMLEDTLTLARQGKMVSEREFVRLAEVVAECQTVIETGKATIDVEDDVAVHGDRDRVRQVVENLIANAVEHGGPAVRVRVGTLEDGFYVEDNGPGIPEDEREMVFEPGQTTSEDGAGFGLTIVSRIVEAHGWEVSVTEGADGGARFEVTGVELEGRD